MLKFIFNTYNHNSYTYNRNVHMNVYVKVLGGIWWNKWTRIHKQGQYKEHTREKIDYDMS